jgi:hypothetical protein
MIATPSRTGRVTAIYMRSVTSTMIALCEAGHHCRWDYVAGNFVQSQRNELVKTFLGSDCTDLLFADDDIGWDIADLLRMIMLPVPLVGAICPRRDGGWNASLIMYKDEPVKTGVDGLYAAHYVGTGLMRLKREVFDVIGFPWFDVQYAENGRLRGEDVHLCNQWRAAGRTVYAAPWVGVSHVGEKIWRGRYDGNDQDDSSGRDAQHQPPAGGPGG